jgi:hypothetical protein
MSEVCRLGDMITWCLNTVHIYYCIFIFVFETGVLLSQKRSTSWLFATKDLSE